MENTQIKRNNVKYGDTIILIKMPPMDDFDDIIAETRRQGRAAGLTPKDIEDAIAEVRGRKKP